MFDKCCMIPILKKKKLSPKLVPYVIGYFTNTIYCSHYSLILAVILLIDQPETTKLDFVNFLKFLGSFRHLNYYTCN